MLTSLKNRKRVIFGIFAICFSLGSVYAEGFSIEAEMAMEVLADNSMTADQPGKLIGHSYTPDDKISGYLLYLPKDYYDNPNKKYPVVVFFHGTGEKGTNLELLKRVGPPKMISQGKDFPFILIAPQARYTFDNNSAVIDKFIEDVRANYRTDHNRLYVTGLSMGGAATWYYANYYPNKVAAAVPICGWGNPNIVCEMKDVPTWAFHNEGDPIVGSSGTKNMINVFKKCGGVSPLMTIYPTGGHDAWTRTYNDQAMWDWLLSQSKNSTTTPPANKAPIANAGGNKTLTLPNNSINLVGSGTDSDGTIASYQWTKISGPNATLTDANKSTLKLTNLVEGSYKFKLTVKDNQGATGSAEAIVNVLPNTSVPPITNKNGLLYTYYEGSFNQLPDFSKLTSVKSGHVNTFDLSIRKRSDNFAVVFEAQIDISAAGNYTFYTNSDDGSKLYINNKEVVNNDGIHSNIERSGNISLGVGRHNIRVEYFDNTGGEVLGVNYAGPGISKQLIPQHILYKPETLGNKAPIANAGSDKTITLPTNSISITGSGTDTDGTITAYQWTKASGPAVTIADANKATVKLSNLVEGTYTFKLTVTDNDGANASDEVKVVVNKALQSPAPRPGDIGDENGLLYSYYEGDFDKLPNFSTINAVKTGHVQNFDLNVRKRNDHFAIVYEGKIKITSSGTYTFYTTSDDGSKLYINNKEVVNNDGIHSRVERSGSVTLNEGLHDIRVAYFEKIGGEILEVKYAGPGISKQAIPSGKLYISSDGKNSTLPSEDHVAVKNSISINFNDQYNPNQGAPWNNIGKKPYENLKISNLKDHSGKATSLSITFLSKWGGSGSNASAPSTVVPANVAKTYFWTVNPDKETLKISGLDKSQKYAFTFYGFRSGSGNNTTEYTIGNKTVSLNAANNTSNTKTITGISPDANGNVLIHVEKHAAASFGYLNSLVIETSGNTVASDNPVATKSFSMDSQLEKAELSKVYPNPVIDNLGIQLSSSEGGFARISLSDLTGRALGSFDYPIVQGQNILEVDITPYGVSKGIFILTIELPNRQIINHRLIKN